MTTISPPITDLLRVSDLDAEHLEQLLELAAAMKEQPYHWHDALPARSLACFFAKPSTRTRVSLEGAAQRLGMLPIMLRPDELQLGRGEPIADTARVLSSYASAIVIRTFAQATIEGFAAAATVPVINALTNEHHPCQALADLLTIRERVGPLEGTKLAYIGDGNNVAHSLLEAAALTGMHLAVAAPAGYWPEAAIIGSAQAAARHHGAVIDVVEDPREAVAGADAVYTDVWVSMGDEDEQDRRRQDLARYRVDAELMALANRDAIFLHCLPAHRGEEVSADVIDGPASAVWQQAANRLPTEQALIYALVTDDWEAQR